MIKKLLGLIGFNILNYYFIEFLSIYTLKNYILFIMFIVSINFIYGLNEKDNYNVVCLQNIMLYNRILQYEDIINFEKQPLKDSMLNDLKNYQKSLGKCIIPYCINDKNNKNLCENHSKFKDEKCSICLDKIDDDVLPQKCGHFFHQDCVSKIINNICPLCRSKI